MLHLEYYIINIRYFYKDLSVIIFKYNMFVLPKNTKNKTELMRYLYSISIKC